MLLLSSQMKLAEQLASGKMLPTRLEMQVPFPGDDPIISPRLSSQAMPGSLSFSEVSIKMTPFLKGPVSSQGPGQVK